MSDPTEHPLFDGVEDQSDERLPWRRVMVIAWISLAVFALAAMMATWLAYDMTGRVRDARAAIVTTKFDREQIGIVETGIISAEVRAQKLKRAQLQQLDTYGWVDRERKLIHLPIERGMQLVVEGRR